MVKMTIDYQGEKHCELMHGPSGSKIGTDAPKDNNGKGELFSPTDLLGAATGSCMLTVMSIAAEKDGLELKGAKATVEKEMSANPRKVAKLNIVIHLPKTIPTEYRPKLENVALNCPVKLSLHPDLQTPVIFNYDI